MLNDKRSDSGKPLTLAAHIANQRGYWSHTVAELSRSTDCLVASPAPSDLPLFS